MVPFTGSHPAAVLPFLRTGLVPAALVIGSMSPDVPYYLSVNDVRPLTHSLLGVVTVDLVAGLVCFALWVWLVAPAALAIGPRGMRDRLAGVRVTPARADLTARWLVLVVVSLVVGALTHLVWDAFTHSGTWGPEHVEWLRKRQGPLRGFRWAQYASGLIGAALLAWTAARWWRRTEPAPGATREVEHPAAPPRLARAVWVALGSGVLMAGAAGMWWGWNEPDGGGWERAAFRCATWGGACGAVLAVGFAVAWRLWPRPVPPPQRSSDSIASADIGSPSRKP